MTLDLQQKATRRMRRAVVVLVAVILVLVGLVVVLSVTGDDGPANGAPGPQTSPSAQPTDDGRTTLPDDDGGYVAPEHTVKLPTGASKTGTLPIRFPHLPEGAAALAVASARNAWSLDASEVRAGILAYAASDVRDDMAAVAGDGAKGNREYSGVPATGKLPVGATLTAWPIGVQWTAVDLNTVDVLVLLRVTHSPGGGAKETTEVVVSPTRAIWDASASDWKIRPTDPTDNLPDPVDIGTDAFNSAGWRAIQEGERQ